MTYAIALRSSPIQDQRGSGPPSPLDMVLSTQAAAVPLLGMGAVYLFCIPEIHYISGQVIVVGGGMNL